MDTQPRRTYTPRQTSVPLEVCLTRQPQRSMPYRAPSTPATKTHSTSLTVWGVSWGLMLTTALGGMGTGAGVMALLVPWRVAPEQPAPNNALEPAPQTPQITARPEVLLAPADNRPLIKQILNRGGRTDPFQSLTARSITPIVAPIEQPIAPVQSVSRLSVEATVGRRILPPPELLPELLPPDITALSTVIEAVPPALPSAPIPSLQAVLPAQEKPVLQDLPETEVLHLTGVAISGETRIAMIQAQSQGPSLSVALGETIDGWQVLEIGFTQVTLIRGAQKQILTVGK
ncbi:MAG: hypothetical protein H7Y22_13990 [Gemmatimonadaceae bacterium]|nr:hypothetical protein [Gloeobacterales cyanobacterium ES-bin-141]